MLSGTEPGMSLDKHLFQLTCLVSASDIKLSARSEVGGRQLLALVMGCGDLTLHYMSEDTGQLPVMRRVPWFADSNKKIAAICFDPSGSWLLIAAKDGSIFIVPALSLVDPNAVLDHRWSTSDLTTFPSPLLQSNSSSNSSVPLIPRSRPTSIVWWQSLLECHHVAIMGTESGDLIFISLTTGLQVGITFVRATVSMLHICQDNSLDSIFLLITSDKRMQWKLLLEQRATGYGWPIDSSGSAVKVVTSNNELSSSSHNSLDLEFGNRNTSHLPTTRSRLQGLKQLSVEKLTSLRQRLAETRSKGAAAMAVNIHFRRESSGSSSDDTAGSSSVAVKSSAAESSDLPATHHVTTGPQPEKLSSEVGDTFLQPQYARGRHLLSGYYAPTSILTIHGMSLDVVPLFVHKLAPNCRDVLVTDKFLYVTHTGGTQLSVVSCQLSESRLDGDCDYNPESVIETYEMKSSEERIICVYKRTDDHHRRSSGSSSRKQSVIGADKDTVPQVSFDLKSRGSSREKERKSASTPFSLPKSVQELKLDTPSIDTCVIVTTTGVYEISLSVSPAEVFMDLVMKHQALERAERLAHMFGLNLQQLLEAAGDLKLSAKEFSQAIALYKLSRCRHLKSVLKFAAGGHAAELLSYITLLFSTSGLDLTTSERIHLSNLAVMSHTEQVLRATIGKVMLFKQFLKFLRENLFYDEVLAVNVAGQTGLWEVLQFLASYRGLHPEVLDILTKIVRSLGEGLAKAVENKTNNIKYLPALDSGLWLCVSDPSLLQSLLCKPQQARIHLQFVRTCLPYLEQFALQRLAALYDPSSPQLRPTLKKMFKIGHKREHSSGSYSSYTTQMDSIELMDTVDEIFVHGEDIVQTYLLVLLYLGKKRQVSSYVYIPELMEKIQFSKDDDDDEDCEDLCPSLPVLSNTLCAGFSHVALVRNGAIYTWGNAVQGCLGTGPTMSRYSCPQQIGLFSSLKLEVISVQCGRQHTLALTDNGVYAWGSSQYGQLGIGKTGQCPYPRLVEHLSRERIIGISAGQYHSIALADDGRVFTWGWGVHGQLGHNSVEDCHIPTLVERLIGKVVTQICGGHGHTVVLTAEGQVYTFGSSVFGQLGNGSNLKSSVPVHVAVLTERITLIATNYFHNLAVSSSNKLYVWGSSPQVLRLQAQAQKKARLLQQQSSTPLPTISSPVHLPHSSPSRTTKPITAQVHSAMDNNVEISGTQLESNTDSEEPTSTYHNPTFSDPGDGEVSNPNLNSLLGSCGAEMLTVNGSHFSSANSSRSHDLSSDARPSHSPSVTNIVDSSKLDPNTKSPECHRLSPESGGNMNNDKQSSQDRPVSNGESVHGPEDLLQGSGLENSADSQSSHANSNEGQFQSRTKNQDFHTKSKQLPTSVFSDFENANTENSSGNLHLQSKRTDQTLNLKDDSKSNNPMARLVESSDDGQAHLVPQIVDTSLVVGPITQISCGCHHSALLTRDGVLYMWGRNLDGQLGNGTRKEVPIPTPLTNASASAAQNAKSSSSSQSSPMPRSPSLSGIIGSGDKLKIKQVSCGCEFTVVQENSSTGKVWAWGNNSQAQLGRAPVEDSKALEGKLVMLKTTKRVIKLPHGSQNSSDIPREVPGLPNATITFKYDNLSGMSGWCGSLVGTPTELCPPLCSIEEPCYGLRTLHFTFQHFHDHYDSTYIMNKCLELENYQAAAKLAALDRHYHLALAYQLKALALSSMERGFSMEKNNENQSKNSNKEANEQNSNCNRILTNNIVKSRDTTNVGNSSSSSSVDKLKYTKLPPTSNICTDKNSNPLILNYKEEVHQCAKSTQKTDIVNNIGSENKLTSTNSVKQNKDELTNNTDAVKKCETTNKTQVDSSKCKSADSEGNVINNENSLDLVNISENSDNKNKIHAEPETEKDSVSNAEVENRNQRNSKIKLGEELKAESKGNQIAKDKSKVEFSGDICTHLDADSKQTLVQSNIGKNNSYLEKEEVLGLEKGSEESQHGTNSKNKNQEESLEEIESSSSISTPESLTSANAPDSEMHAFAVQGGTEQMSEGHRYLTSPDSSTSPLVSEEQGLLSPEPFLPPTTQAPGVSLVPVIVNGDSNISNNEVKPDIQKELPTTQINSISELESDKKINKEDVCKNSDLNTAHLNSRPSQGIPDSNASENVTIQDSGRNETCLKTEITDVSNISNSLQEDLVSNVTTCDKTTADNKIDGSYHIIPEKVYHSEKLQGAKDSSTLPKSDSREENISMISNIPVDVNSVSKLSIKTVEAERQVTTKQSCSDRTDLENYENELKVSSGDNSSSVKLLEMSREGVPSSLEMRKSGITSIETDKTEKAPSTTMYGTSSCQKTEDGSTEPTACKDLVAQAAAIVEYYVSVMEEDSHTMMSRLLQQGIEFWLSHSLPVDHLENLLLKHMSKFFYPLGLLLFCKGGSTGEEEVETQQQAMSMLNHLSTRFCLQLCSSLLSHIDQRKAYPEYIELLAQVTSMQTAPGLNGCYVTGQGLSQSPEQLMETILEGLGATKGLGGPLGPAYISLQEEVSESCKDPTSDTAKLEQLLAFSCGHHYGWSVFHQSVLPELELGLLQLHHPLPNTARVLKGLFGSNSPNLHLACPRCVLSYLQSQTSPPL